MKLFNSWKNLETFTYIEYLNIYRNLKSLEDTAYLEH